MFGGPSIPLRRWEDWERSRLRKLRREERRRREFERAHPQGFNPNEEYLGVRSEVHSQYDGSDTVSVTSSDDQWGHNIGEYNENNTQYPPPPPGLHSLPQQALQNAKVIGGDDLEAMLEAGWDDGPSPSASTDFLHPAPPLNATHAPRYQLSDGPPANAGYSEVSRGHPPPVHSPVSPTPVTRGASSAVGDDWKTHVKRRSGGGRTDYGPLGPLDPGGVKF